MQIDFNANPALRDAFIQRLKAEYAETASANFVLDMLASQLTHEKAELEQRVGNLVEANTKMTEDNRLLRSELERVTRPERASKRG